MKTVQLKKMAKAISLGMALLLTVGIIPFRAFATELPKTTVTLGVELQVSGDESPEEDAFTFLLESQDTAAPMPESNTVTIQGSGHARFDEITYTEIGSYDYTISQKKSTLEGYTFDNSVYYVNVTVEQKDQGGLVALITVQKNSDRSKTDAIVFNNQYTTPEKPVETETETVKETETETTVPETTPNKTTTTTKTTPKTGDTTNITLLLAMLLFSGLLVGCIWKVRKKQ